MTVQSCILTVLILKAAPAGEYDKRITILTAERGKVTAFARGARRPKSSMQAATDLFCFGKFEAYEGRDAYTVVRADIQNYFRDLYTDIDRMYYGCYFLELADYFTHPCGDGMQQLKLLYQTIGALGVRSLDPRLVRRIYELKTLVYYGVSPQVFSCVKCGKKENLTSFYTDRRGTVCGACADRPGGIALDGASLYTLQYIVSSPIAKLYTFQVTEPVYETVSGIIDRYLKLYVDRELKTQSFLPSS